MKGVALFYLSFTLIRQVLTEYRVVCYSLLASYFCRFKSQIHLFFLPHLHPSLSEKTSRERCLTPRMALVFLILCFFSIREIKNIYLSNFILLYQWLVYVTNQTFLWYFKMTKFFHSYIIVDLFLHFLQIVEFRLTHLVGFRQVSSRLFFYHDKIKA